jgi:polyhydroxyalkanoic acid synthase PhaR subunit
VSQKDSANPFDPFGTWTTMRDAMLETWSKAMIDVVNSDAYAQATGALLDNYLSMSTPFQQAVETAMGRILAQLNMPSRAEVTGLAERLTNIEMRLDDLDAKLDAIQGLLQEPARWAGSGSRTSGS